MDCLCPICYTDITEETGHVVLSCSHKFHLGCITKWFYSVEVETCPCCRKETSEKEKMPLASEEEASAEEEDDNDYVRLPTGNWVPRLQITIQNQPFEEMAIERSVREAGEKENHAALIIQSSFCLYRMRKEAAKVIQKVWRGYSTREMLKRRSSYVSF
jgi:hypothetical protein